MDRTANVGTLLKGWRRKRRMSQLALALDTGVSARHVSFVETGRSRPSRGMVLTLAAALDVPLRERNDLLLAAGFAPLYRESPFELLRSTHVRRAIDLILSNQEPYPAVVMDRHWNVLTSNRSAARFFGWLLEGSTIEPPMNVLRLMFDPRAVRPYVVNWKETAQCLVDRARREAVCGVPDEALESLLDELMSLAGVPLRWTPDPEVLELPVIPVEFAKDGVRESYFSTVTTLGTPQDVTLQELRIECFFPADTATEAVAAARMSLA